MKICRKRLYTLTLPDAGTTRDAPGTSRTVHGERERHLAGPDGVPTLGAGQGAGKPCRTRPLRRAVRRTLFEPALPRFRDRRDHPRPRGIRGRGRPRRRPEREEWRFLEGHTWAEQEQRNPELAKKFLAIPEEERWALVGAETDEEVIARFEEAISSIRALHPGGARIVVVSHGGVMRAFLRELFGPEVLPGAQRAANASITRLQWGETGPRLLEVASTAHLTEDPGASTVE